MYRALRLLAFLGPHSRCERDALREDLGYSEDQFRRAIEMARRILTPLGHDLIVERERNSDGGWTYYYGATVTLTRLLDEIV